MARVVFMGTPEYALPSLALLHEQHQVVLVITQPDRRSGRGQQVSPSPVKAFALAHGLPVWQPHTLRPAQAAEQLTAAAAAVYVTAAIGLILPAHVLAIPPHGCINVHASLLPRWRGAAPISAAILHGDAETGVTLMRTDEGLDTGPILSQERIPIRPDDTTASLTGRLAQLGADMLARTLPRWLAGEITPRPQPEEGVTLAPRIVKEDGRIDWTRSAGSIERMVRAYTPWPGTYTTYRGQMFKIHRAQALPDRPPSHPPGQILAAEEHILVATGQGVLVLQLVQLAGKPAVPAADFARGQRGLVGTRLGHPV